MGNKKKFWSKNNGRNLAILIIFLATLPYTLLAGLVAWALLTNDPPESFDFSVYAGHVTQVDIIDWTGSDDHDNPLGPKDYRIILTLDESQIPDLLTELSEVDFYRSGPGDPPGFGGRCFLITLDDGTFRVVGRHGYVHYGPQDKSLKYYTDLWRYIREDDFNDLYEPYLGR